MPVEVLGLGIKSCRICSFCKPLNEFVKSKVFKSGYDTICLICSREKVKLWRKENKERHNFLNSQYTKRNPGLRNAIRRKYELAKIKRIPLWADINKIKDIYKNCPPGYQVDHIIPLQGELVSGLHVEDNLQYLPATINQSKGNKWIPI